MALNTEQIALITFLAAFYPGGMQRSGDLMLVAVDTPKGQLSWWIPFDSQDQFEDFPPYEGQIESPRGLSRELILQELLGTRIATTLARPVIVESTPIHIDVESNAWKDKVEMAKALNEIDAPIVSADRSLLTFPDRIRAIGGDLNRLRAAMGQQMVKLEKCMNAACSVDLPFQTPVRIEKSCLLASDGELIAELYSSDADEMLAVEASINAVGEIKKIFARTPAHSKPAEISWPRGSMGEPLEA